MKTNNDVNSLQEETSSKTESVSIDQPKEKMFYLSKNKEFVACELVKNSKSKRIIKLLEGEKAGKETSVHPEGVAWGSLYPRLFRGTERPNDFFIFKGRVLIKNSNPHNLVPSVDSNYRFQSFLTHVIDCVNSGENILLTGGAGVGKTSHVEQLAARTGQPLIRVNFNGETRLSDFIGKTQVINGETVWVDGVLPMAMREGYWLLLDEIDFADPSVLSLLHPVLEENSCIVLKENSGEVVRPHSNFRVFATANSIGAMQDRANNYSGTNHMNEAFLDRWQVLLVPNLSNKEEIKIVKNKVKGIKNRWAKRIVEFAQKVRDRSLEGMDSSSDTFSTRRVLAWAKKSALLRCPIDGAKLAWLDKMPASEHEPMLRFLELHFGNKAKRKKSSVPELSLETKEDKTKKKRGRPKGSKNKV